MTTATSTARTLSWTTDAHDRMEAARVVESDRGLRINGYIVSAVRGAFGAFYSVHADGNGRTRRLTVRSDDGDGEHSLNLTHTADGQWLVETSAESAAQRSLEPAQDIAISRSPMTLTLAVRRLGLHRQAGEGTLTVVRVKMPSLTFEPVTYHYDTVTQYDDGARIGVDGGPEGAFEIVVDGRGFVTAAPSFSQLG